MATLAAATSGSTVADALQWLESQGISMKDSSTDSAIFQNALESGQTMSLTEAGKMALNLVKDQQIQSSSSVSANTNTSAKNSKVITIVADSAQLPQIISSTQATPIVVVSGSGLTGQDSQESQLQNKFLNRKNANTLKINKTLNTTNTKMHSIGKTSNIKHLLISNSVNDSNLEEVIRDRDKLSSELKTTKQQLEEYKNKLIEKDKELDKYKQQLEEMRAIHS